MNRLHVFIGICLVLAACRSSPVENKPVYLPGLYVNQTETEFSRVVDTFSIRKSSLDGTDYLVSRKSSFQRIRDGIKSPPEAQTDQWPAAFDPKEGVLRATGKGKDLTYDPARNEIYNGKTGYEKIE